MKPKPPLENNLRQKLFYGWVILAIGIMAMILTAPGQTVGVSEFKGIYEQKLDLSSRTVALYYCYGTAIGSLALPLFGFIIDRMGCRFALALVALLFGITCYFCGMVKSQFDLLMAFTFLRMLGQGALSLVASTMVSLWFKQKLAIAYTVMSVGSGLGMMLVPYVFKPLFENHEFVVAFQYISFGIMALIPVAIFYVIDRPQKIGLSQDGAPMRADEVAAEAIENGTTETETNDLPKQQTVVDDGESFTFRQAIATRTFWIVTAVQSAWALIGTGLVFNRKSILESFGTSEYLIDLAVPGLFGSVVISQIITGLIARKFSHSTLISTGCMGMVIACLLVLTQIPIVAFLGFATFGFSQGIFIIIGQSLWADFYGRSHIGKIRGLVWMIVVCASSLGGFALTLEENPATQYRPIQISAAALSVLFVACLFINKPKRPNELIKHS